MARRAKIGRRLSATGTLVVLGSVGLFPIAPARAAGCGPVEAETLHIHVSPARPVVHAGEKITLTVTAERAVGHHDVAPAEGARALVFATIGNVTFGSAGTTDAHGVASITTRVPRRAGVGLADVTATAAYEPVHCVEERGETTELGLFRVRR